MALSRKRSTTPSYRIIVGVSDQVTPGILKQVKRKIDDGILFRRQKKCSVKINYGKDSVNMNKNGKN